MAKNYLFQIILIALLSNNITWAQNDSLTDNSRIKSLKKLYDRTLVKLSNIPDSDLNESVLTVPSKDVTEVNLQAELVTLFDPDHFKCNYDQKLVKQLKKMKNDGGTDGFVPSIVLQRIKETVAYKLSGDGSCILANSFSYLKAGKESDPIYLKYSPTSVGFNEANYIETTPGAFSNFFYNLDCSGYFGSALAASGGIDKNVAKISATNASSVSNSLVIIKGVMYLPLYQAYKKQGLFNSSRKEILSIRKAVLSEIIQAVPKHDQSDDLEILLNTNYKVLLTSNTGKSSFNGEAEFSAEGGTGFGFGTVAGSGQAKAKISRSSAFSGYDSYILATNYKTPPDKITYKDLKDIITEIDKEILLASEK